VEARGGVPGRDADIGRCQLLLLGRQGSDGEHCRKGMHFEVTVAHGHSFPSVPPEYYEPLSDASTGWRHGGFVAMWGAMVAEFIVPLVTTGEAPLL
jgi:hypothetical protein